ncbi:telomerase Cajal body protein 1 [Pseudomyrmex gracilis]|uniref:telomerase Cajal body protein 1 n=1 Tax=Pseudomyrmex gracilis TaxID=219809 RepID=UPI000994DCEB|nr:telomerase Cajal body protein 1 [Pseudomyrmex gracilis]
MECENLGIELRALPTENETSPQSDTVENNAESGADANNQEQLKLFTETEKSCKTYSGAASVENEIHLDNSSQSHVMHDDVLFSDKINSAASEQTKTTSIREVKAINSEDTESTDSTSFHYNWSKAPKLLYVVTKEYEPTNLCENFTKGCKWSPDGTCLLVPSEDFRLRIYELPRDMYSGHVPSDFTQTSLASALTVKEGGLIYDSCWYPFMNSWEPATCCFLSSSRESPVHLWDAFTGKLRATYRAYNQVDEVEASISVQFINSGREIWCGFKNAVRIFDTDRPGRQTSTIEFKHDFPNMIGLVSCVRENPIMPGLVAFGTYSKCIGLYKDGPLCALKTSSGVTQVEFSSCGTKLFSVVRKNNEFLCWDLRNPGNVLYSFEGRESDTNQRIQFDITPDNKQIISGGIDGNISVWELPEITEYDEDLIPKYKIQLSKDCINGISLHRTLPILATSSGQRQCDIETNNRDNSVRFWWVS